MPIIKSAKKRMKQNAVRRARNFATRRMVKQAIRSFTDLIKDKKVDEAKKALPSVYKAIDTAEKKNIMHANKAARKKSQMAKMVA